MEITHSLDREGAMRILEAWKPYGGLIYMHLLLDHLADGEYIDETAPTEWSPTDHLITPGPM